MEDEEEALQSAAAVKIQALQRGRAARRQEVPEGAGVGDGGDADDAAETQEQEMAALKIQAVFRGKAARKCARPDTAAYSCGSSDQEREIAALKIQSAYRGNAARKRVAILKGGVQKEGAKPSEDESEAAKKIQALQRGRVTRRSLSQVEKACHSEGSGDQEREAAALKIQSQHRGRAARKRVCAMKEKQAVGGPEPEPEPAPEARDHAAATKIQSVQRGRVARKQTQSRRDAQREAKEQEAAATKIQSVQRGRTARKEAQQKTQVERDSAEEESAALKIQSLQRGRTARKQAASKAKQDSIDAGEEQERELAALKIQSVHRGNAARKAAAGRRRAHTEQPATEQTKPSEDETEAAKKIQALQRGRVTRRSLSQVEKACHSEGSGDQEREAAALKIQSQHRGRAARKRVCAMKEKQAVGGPEPEPEPAPEARDHAAATKIQSVQRGRVARKQAQSRRDAQREAKEQEAAATKIQSVQRGRVARKQAQSRRATAATAPQEHAQSTDTTPNPEQDKAATKIQAVHRGRETRKSLSHTDKASAGAGSEEQEMEIAAMKIQSIQRGNTARKSVTALQDKASHAGSEEQEMEMAAMKIQSLQRGNTARKSITALQDKASHAGSEEQEMEMAAMKIQSLQRGNTARKSITALQDKASHAGSEEQEQEEAARRIQNVHRSSVARRRASIAREEREQDTERLFQESIEHEQHVAAQRIQAVHRGSVHRDRSSGDRTRPVSADYPTAHERCMQLLHDEALRDADLPAGDMHRDGEMNGANDGHVCLTTPGGHAVMTSPPRKRKSKNKNKSKKRNKRSTSKARKRTRSHPAIASTISSALADRKAGEATAEEPLISEKDINALQVICNINKKWKLPFDVWHINLRWVFRTNFDEHPQHEDEEDECHTPEQAAARTAPVPADTAGTPPPGCDDAPSSSPAPSPAPSPPSHAAPEQAAPPSPQPAAMPDAAEGTPGEEGPAPSPSPQKRKKRMLTLENFNENYYVECLKNGVEPDPLDTLITSPRSALIILRNGFTVRKMCKVPKANVYSQATLEGVSKRVAKERHMHWEERRVQQVTALRELYAITKAHISRNMLAYMVRNSAMSEKVRALQCVMSTRATSTVASPLATDTSRPNPDTTERRNVRLVKEKYLGLPTAPLVYDTDMQLLVGQIRVKCMSQSRQVLHLKKKLMQMAVEGEREMWAKGEKTREHMAACREKAAETAKATAGQVRQHTVELKRRVQSVREEEERRRAEVLQKLQDRERRAEDRMAVRRGYHAEKHARHRDFMEARRKSVKRASDEQAEERVQIALGKQRRVEDQHIREAALRDMRREELQQQRSKYNEERKEKAKLNAQIAAEQFRQIVLMKQQKSEQQVDSFKRNRSEHLRNKRENLILKEIRGHNIRCQAEVRFDQWMSTTINRAQQAAAEAEKAARARQLRYEIIREKERQRGEDRRIEKDRLRTAADFHTIALLETQVQKHAHLDCQLSQRQAAALQAGIIQDESRIQRASTLTNLQERELQEQKCRTFHMKNDKTPLFKADFLHTC